MTVFVALWMPSWYSVNVIELWFISDIQIKTIELYQRSWVNGGMLLDQKKSRSIMNWHRRYVKMGRTVKIEYSYKCAQPSGPCTLLTVQVYNENIFKHWYFFIFIPFPQGKRLTRYFLCLYHLLTREGREKLNNIRWSLSTTYLLMWEVDHGFIIVIFGLRD